MKRLFVVGLGPGGRDGMTLEAKKALEQSEVICGYTAYADLIREYYPEKEYLVSGMTKEVERLSVQSVEQKAGGLFKLGVPDCIRVLCTGYALWLGADDRKTG